MTTPQPGRQPDPDRPPPSAVGSGDEPSWFDRALVRYSPPELVVSHLIIGMLVLASSLGLFSIVILIVLLLVGGAAHVAAIEAGRADVLWVSTIVVATLGLLTLLIYQAEARPVSLAMVAVVALAYNEAVRLSFGRRRNGVVTDAVLQRSAIGIGAIALGSIVAVQAAAALSGEVEDRPWLWMPIAAAALTFAILALLWIPSVGRRPNDRQRWRPGERLPPPPLPQAGEDQPRFGPR
ncbi:MAG: hypothetical protein AAF467_25440 [Actinomycetota bacterium]